MKTTLQDFTSKENVMPGGTIPIRSNGILIETGLEKYKGEWNKKTAAHLLRRATFGPRIQDIKDFSAMSLDSAIEIILEFNEPEKLPLNYKDKNDPYAKIGETWYGLPSGPNNLNNRLESLMARWCGNIITSGNNVGEKMTLFWHNHFVTQMLTVRDEQFTYNYYNTLRENALGNFRHLTEKMTTNSAMLRYLNGNENIVGRPNENFARELLELFTVGKGPLIGPGDYTNYTEDDVVAAAKVLTGWRALRDTVDSKFTKQLHDRTSKQFSSAFGNKVIKNSDENEYKELISMIFDQDETARFICRKIYRWFVYYEIDQQTEDNVITPMADILRANDYEIKPVLKALFSSAHFYDNWNIGCVIKSPLDFAVSSYRILEVKFPENYKEQYAAWLNLGFQYVSLQEMTLGEPPSVSGWPAMYQSPTYHRLWVSSVSAPYRALLADILATVQKIENREYSVTIDFFNLAKQTSNPGEVKVLIKELSEYLHPVPLTELQLEYLRDNLLPEGLADSQWTAAWTGHIVLPDNETNNRDVEYLLRLLTRACLNIAEFSLS